MEAMNGPFAAFRAINDTKTLAATVRAACLQVREGCWMCDAISPYREQQRPHAPLPCVCTASALTYEMALMELPNLSL